MCIRWRVGFSLPLSLSLCIESKTHWLIHIILRFYCARSSDTISYAIWISVCAFFCSCCFSFDIFRIEIVFYIHLPFGIYKLSTSKMPLCSCALYYLYIYKYSCRLSLSSFSFSISIVSFSFCFFFLFRSQKCWLNWILFAVNYMQHMNRSA